MCGIAGFWNCSTRTSQAELAETARRMASTLRHRGPDDGGVWADARSGVALGHRRLAILDLSQEGHQPMRSADGRYVLVLNGEIYNVEGLRRELRQTGHAFRGHSDTEVMLAGFCEWGLASALERFVGMFAFALWDGVERVLLLGRDRVGEKPLYYGWAGETFLFGSELKALRAHPGWEATVSRSALAMLVQHGYIPAPHCIYENCFKLMPGCMLSLNQEQLSRRHLSQPKHYWSFAATALAGVRSPFQGRPAEAQQRLLELLRQAVAQQMVADVPVGAFLSGGIDSSTIVALMQAESRRPIKTFSIVFDEHDFDEAPHAKAVARHLGTDHVELYVRETDLQRVIPQLPTIYDEPFGDFSQIPTVLLCALSRQQVTVSLSGDAGDELFGGYSAYRRAQRMWSWMRRIPATERATIAGYLRMACAIGPAGAGKPGRSARIVERLTNVCDLLPATCERSFYEQLMSGCREPQAWLEDPDSLPATLNETALWEELPTFLRRMMSLDFVSYLPDDILVKVDRAAMAVGLETRIPLLDHRIVEFAWQLPEKLIQRRGRTKWLLRQILHQHVPRALVDRPKAGFAVPVAQWLRGSLRSWAEDWLSEGRLRQQGFFKSAVLQEKWREHLSGKRDWSQPLWNVLAFQTWFEKQKVSSRGLESDLDDAVGIRGGERKMVPEVSTF